VNRSSQNFQVVVKVQSVEPWGVAPGTGKVGFMLTDVSSSLLDECDCISLFIRLHSC
jgi:hypothetical protein